MAYLEGSYYGIESQAVAGGRWFKVAGATLGGSCLVLLCIAATSSFPPVDESTNLFSSANPKRTFLGHQQHLRLPHKPLVSTVLEARNNPDTSNIFKKYGIGQFSKGKLPMSAIRANHHDWGDGFTYAINPHSRLGKLALEARRQETPALKAPSADIKDEMLQMEDESDDEAPLVGRGVLSKARNMAGVIYLTNFFDRLGFTTDASM